MIASGTTIAESDRAAWLAERRNGLGASDCAAALGLSPYRTPLDLYYEKIGELPGPEETPAMRRGRALEGHVLDEYEGTVAPILRRQVFLRHPEHPWLTATADAFADGGAIVEAKVVGWRQAREWGEEGTDDVPRHYLAQVHHQLAVTGAARCDVAALVGGSDFRVYPVRREDEAFYRELIARLHDFWRHVVRREPPPPTLPADAPHLARLWPGCEGEVELDGDVAAAAYYYQRISAAIKSYEKTRERARAQILTALGNARVGVLPDGDRIKRSVVEIPEATITRKARTEVRLYIPRTKEAEDGDGDAGAGATG